MYVSNRTGWTPMSWNTINAILGLAATDDAFCQRLLKNPIEAIEARNFHLTSEEKARLRSISTQDLAEFSQTLLALFKHNS